MFHSIELSVVVHFEWILLDIKKLHTLSIDKDMPCRVIPVVGHGQQLWDFVCACVCGRGRITSAYSVSRCRDTRTL